MREALPNPVTSLTGIACPAAMTCYSVGTVGKGGVWDSGAAVKTSDGSTWVTQNLPIPKGGKPAVDLAGVACPSPSTCFAVGARTAALPGPVVMATTDGGSHWSSQISPGGTGLSGLTAVACPAIQTCYAVGGSRVISTSDGGATWTSRALLGGAGSFAAVTCVSAAACYASGVDQHTGTAVVVATVTGFTSRASHVWPQGVNSLRGIARRRAPATPWEPGRTSRVWC